MREPRFSSWRCSRRTRAVISFAWLALSGVGTGTDAVASIWQPRSPAPGARGLSFLYQSPVRLGSRLYVVQRGVREYDPARDVWTDFEAPGPTPRYHHATAAANGRIYVLAGSVRGEPREWVSTVEEFDPSTRAWRTRSPMPGGRRNAGSVTLDGRIYVLGGEGAMSAAMPIVRYDPIEDRWTTMRAATRVRQCWGAQAINGKIYILGNPGREEPPEVVFDIYDPIGDTITTGASLPRQRMAFATAAADGKLLVLGGSPGNNAPLGYIDVYDPATDSWTVGPDLPEAKCWLGAITLGETLYVLGGIAGDFSKPAPVMYATDLASVLPVTRSAPALEPAMSPGGVRPAPYAIAHPVKFAEGAVTTDQGDWCTTFSPDGTEVFFLRPPESIVVSRFANGTWNPAETLPFSGTHRDEWPFLSPDGQRLFFCSTRPAARDEKKDWDIWVARRTPSGWAEPQRLPAPINTDASEMSPSVDADGTLYFARGGDIQRARRRGDVYEPPEKLDRAINTPAREFDPRISADGNRLAFCRAPEPAAGDEPKPNIYISHYTAGHWTVARRLPHLDAWRPCFSPDGKELFFSSGGDIYHVALPASASVSETLARLESLRVPQQPDSASVRIRGDPVIYVDPVALPDEMIAKADLILLTHPHPDHLDPATLAKLRQQGTRIVTVRDVSHRLGSEWTDHVTVIAPGEKTVVAGVPVEGVAAYNPRGGPHPQRAGWAGYVVTPAGVRIYFSGDTSFTPEMAALRDIDIAVLNGHAPYQMSGAEMLEAAAAMKPRFIVPVHRGESDRPEIDVLRAHAPLGSNVVLIGDR